MARPESIQSIKLTSGVTPALTTLALIEVPTDTLPQMKRDKIVGFRNFRCDVRVQVKVNTNPFVSGRVIVGYYVPNAYTHREGSYVLGNNFSYLHSLTSLTGCPNVQIDLASGESADIMVPYLNCTSHYDMTQVDPSDPAIAKVPPTTYLFVVAYTDINVPSGVASIQLLAGLENVDLSYPTYPTRHLAGTRNLFKQRLQAAGVTEEEANDLARAIHKDVVVQQGLVSEISGVVGTVANTVAPFTSGVPILGDIVSTVGKIAGPFSKIAGMFGFSKELHHNVPETVEIKTARYAQNIDGVDTPRVVALSSANKLANDADVCTTAEDEMSFAHFLSRSEFLSSFKWDAATGVAGAKLYSIRVDPMMHNTDWQSEANPSAEAPVSDVMSPTHLSFLTTMFRYWRGSLIYRIKFAKTAFHVGRVRVLWLPGDQDPDYDPAVTYVEGNPEASYYHQTIVDLRETNEIEFKVPFSSNRPFNYCESPYYSVTSHPDYCSNGTLLVQALTDLSAPSSVSQYIHCVVEIQAGDDFEVAMFKGVPWTYPTNGGTVMNYGLGKGTGSTVIYKPHANETYGGIGASVYQQSGLGITTGTTSVSAAPGEQQLSVAETSMGERILSWRALSKVYQLNSLINWANAKTTGAGKDSTRPAGMIISPQSMMPYNSVQVVTACVPGTGVVPDLTRNTWTFTPDGMTAQSTHTPDILDALSVCYGFWKGSLRMRIVQRNAGKPTAIVSYMPSSFCDTYGKFNDMPAGYPDTSGFSSPVFPATADECTVYGDGRKVHLAKIADIQSAPHETVVANDVEARDLQLQVPYYQPLTMTRTGAAIQYSKDKRIQPFHDAATGLWYMPHNFYRICYDVGDQFTATDDRPTQFRYYRAAADDFRFHFLQGIPPMALYRSAAIGWNVANSMDTSSYFPPAGQTMPQYVDE